MRTCFFKDNTVQPVALGSIDNLPGRRCSRVPVFHSAFVLPQHRNEGYGNRAHQARLKSAKLLMYNYALVTVAESNEYQIKNLEKNNWKVLDSFISSKTGNKVFLYGRHIDE